MGKRKLPSDKQGRPTEVLSSHPRGICLDFYELWKYRDLFLILVRRDITVMYNQTIMGVAWAIIRPLATMIIFSVIFGKLAKINSDGIPYAIFSFTALVPWSFFSAALSGSGVSLLSSSGMLTKIYFPRVIIPLAPIFSKLLDFLIALILLSLLLIWYKITPGWGILLLPYFVIIMIITAVGGGMILTSLTIQYRDIRHAIGFIVQSLLYISPIVYPTSLIPSRYRLVYGINPMVCVVEGFRSSILNMTPMPWDLLAVGSLSAVIIVCVGVYCFRLREHIFADVV